MRQTPLPTFWIFYCAHGDASKSPLGGSTPIAQAAVAFDETFQAPESLTCWLVQGKRMKRAGSRRGRFQRWTRGPTAFLSTRF